MLCLKYVMPLYQCAEDMKKRFKGASSEGTRRPYNLASLPLSPIDTAHIRPHSTTRTCNDVRPY